MDSDLKPVLIFINQPLNLQEIILLEGTENFFDVVPHLGFDLAAAVSQGKREIGLAGLLRLYLLGNDDEAGRDDFIFVITTVGEEEFLHGVFELKPNGRDRAPNLPSLN